MGLLAEDCGVASSAALGLLERVVLLAGILAYRWRPNVLVGIASDCYVLK